MSFHFIGSLGIWTLEYQKRKSLSDENIFFICDPCFNPLKFTKNGSGNKWWIRFWYFSNGSCIRLAFWPSKIVEVILLTREDCSKSCLLLITLSLLVFPMGGQSLEKPLLVSKGGGDGLKKTPFLVSSLKFILKYAMWVMFIAWSVVFFLNPTEFFSDLNQKYVSATEGTVYGITGSVFLLYSGPIIVIAFLAILHLLIAGEDNFQEKKMSKHPRFRLWTFPVLVDGPFGVVSAAEFIGILIFSVYIIWAVYAYTMKNLNMLSQYKFFTMESSLLLELTGLRLGLIGLFCLAFLFLPIARGSVLLRLVDIPVEHATRYHVWLGHLTMLLFTLHGLFYVIAWAMQGRLLKEILEWKHVGIANLPGVVSLLAGLFMWVTSLGPVRRQNFELFFYAHQLYVVFVVFLVLHVGDFVFSIAAGGIFLFILDRFLRFCQSRRTVNVVSATCLPCGTVELVVSKPANLKYNALSFIFLQVRELSWLQWHPFSVSSSPLDGKYHIAVLIKVLGGWTEKLRGSILRCPMGAPQGETLLQPHPKITVSVEGPYGHESPYHLSYENLILVAGGIGISPFLAILSDILHRINDGEPCLPRNVLIVWAIKNSEELTLLHSLDMESICPFYSNMLNVEIQTYVTRESEPQLEKGKVSYPVSSFRPPVRNRRGISVLVGTGDIMWSGIYVVASTIGLVLLFGLLQILYIKPFGITYWWYKGLMFLGCMVASPIIFGGAVVGLWHLWERKTSAKEVNEDDKQKIDILQDSEQRTYKKSNQGYVGSSNTIHYGRRPDFKEIFGKIGERWGHVDAGVILCGPPALQSSVAKECRSQNLKRRRNDPIFHFNSHSFDL